MVAPVTSMGEALVVPNNNPKGTFQGEVQQWGDALIAIKVTKTGVRIPRLIKPEEILSMVGKAPI